MEANEKSELISIPKLNFSRSFVLLPLSAFYVPLKNIHANYPTMWTPKAKQEVYGEYLSFSLSPLKENFHTSVLNMHASCLRYLILSCLGGFCAEETSHM